MWAQSAPSNGEEAGGRVMFLYDQVSCRDSHLLRVKFFWLLVKAVYAGKDCAKLLVDRRFRHSEINYVVVTNAIDVAVERQQQQHKNFVRDVPPTPDTQQIESTRHRFRRRGLCYVTDRTYRRSLCYG